MTEMALLAGAGTAARAVPLLGLLGVGVDVVSWHGRPPGGAAPTAVLVTSVDLLDEFGLPADGGPAVAVWVTDLEELRRAGQLEVEAVLAEDPALVDHGAVLVPPFGVDVHRWPPLAPLARQRWRQHLDLPADLVVGTDGPLPTDHPETALALAAAAVATGPTVALALALGTPTVTNAASARRLGLRPGVDVEVAARPSEAAALARTIAGDDGRAAALSRRGRRTAERHLDLGRPARHLRQRLGLVAAPAPSPADLVTRRLDELATPDRSPLRLRATAALEPLTIAGA